MANFARTFIALISLAGCGNDNNLAGPVQTVESARKLVISNKAGGTAEDRPAKEKEGLDGKAVMVVRLMKDGQPVVGSDVAFLRSISGQKSNYDWMGRTDSNGQARIEIDSESSLEFIHLPVTGYYKAVAIDPETNHPFLGGQWGSIPINANKVIEIELEIGQPFRIIMVQPLSVLILALDASRLASIKQVQTSLELYFADNNSYPAGHALTLGWASAQMLSSAGFTDMLEWSGTIYMGRIPQNPTPGGAPFIYTHTQVVGGDDYVIEFALDGTISSLSSGVYWATSSGIYSMPTSPRISR